MDISTNKKHPVRQEIEKNIGTFNITASVVEDTQTLAELKHVEGLVAFICTLEKDGHVIAQGRGSSVLNPSNRYISRAVHAAFNSSLSDAVIRATKVLDTLHPNPAAALEAPNGKEANAFEKATDKQRHYLSELIALNVQDEDEREKRQSQIADLTKSEASRMIESFRR
jgi:ABC-type proline/glycine betaine transport system ATPase subunit